MDSQITLIEELRSKGKYDAAEAEVEKAIRYVGQQDGKVEKWILYRLALERGLIQRLLNHSPDAVCTYKRLLAYVDADNELRNDPALVGRAWWELATAHFECSDYQSAALAYEEALQNHSLENSDHYNILLSLGDCSMGTRALAKANDYYHMVLVSSHALEIDKVKARVGMAKVLYELRDYRQAASTFEALLTNYPCDDPGYFNTLFWLGGCFEALRMESRARDCYEDILAAQSALEEDKASARERLKRLTSSSGGSQILH
jgi:tetratricopeptide (TPR) repeat protein